MTTGMRAAIDQMANELDIELIVADGFDTAIDGVVESVCGYSVVYSTPKVIAKLMSDGMTRDEAVEYFNFNILGAYPGQCPPVFTVDLEGFSGEGSDDTAGKRLQEPAR